MEKKRKEFAADVSDASCLRKDVKPESTSVNPAISVSYSFRAFRGVDERYSKGIP